MTVGVGGGLVGLGYSFMLSTDTAGLVWEALLDAGVVPMGSKAWEQIRVWQGQLTLISCDYLTHSFHWSNPVTDWDVLSGVDPLKFS